MTEATDTRRSRQPEADCRSTLTAEIAAYMAMLTQIRAEHGSCWAVVTGGELVKTFGEFGEAAMFVGATYPSGQPVLIRHTDEKPGFAPYIGVPLAPEWQPIETAPKDGTWLLMCAGPPDALGPGFREWKYGLGAFATVFGRRMTWDWPWSFEPTHWMPLPLPPLTDGTRGGSSDEDGQGNGLPSPEAGVFREEGERG